MNGSNWWRWILLMWPSRLRLIWTHSTSFKKRTDWSRNRAECTLIASWGNRSLTEESHLRAAVIENNNDDVRHYALHSDSAENYSTYEIRKKMLDDTISFGINLVALMILQFFNSIQSSAFFHRHTNVRVFANFLGHLEKKSARKFQISRGT